jgi:hypothetical protein
MITYLQLVPRSRLLSCVGLTSSWNATKTDAAAQADVKRTFKNYHSSAGFALECLEINCDEILKQRVFV